MSRSTSFSQTHSAAAVHPSSPLFASLKQRKTMSITQTYYLAHKARGKLSSEAARPDHNLRLLVGHANLLDSLMMELADAEREQESWFNQSVRGATKAQQQDRHVQWADTVVEEPEEDWQAEDADSDSSSDSGSDYDDDDDVEMADAVALRRVPSHTTTTHILITPPTSDEEDEELDDDDEEDYAKLTLTRSPSHSASSPPELDHDLDSSEDEAMPPSPPATVLPTFSSGKQQQQQQQQQQEDMTTEKSFYDDGYYLPPRNPARLVSAISVY